MLGLSPTTHWWYAGRSYAGETFWTFNRPMFPILSAVILYHILSLIIKNVKEAQLIVIYHLFESLLTLIKFWTFVSWLVIGLKLSWCAFVNGILCDPFLWLYVLRIPVYQAWIMYTCLSSLNYVYLSIKPEICIPVYQAWIMYTCLSSLNYVYLSIKPELCIPVYQAWMRTLSQLHEWYYELLLQETKQIYVDVKKKFIKKCHRVKIVLIIKIVKLFYWQC